MKPSRLMEVEKTWSRNLVPWKLSDLRAKVHLNLMVYSQDLVSLGLDPRILATLSRTSSNPSKPDPSEPPKLS
jgi:hypothetical protein